LLQPFDPDHSVARSPPEKQAALPLVEYGHLDFFAPGAQLRESVLKGVFDGFAVCFGLVHLLSSIPVRSRLRRRRNRNAYRGPRVGALLLLGTGRVAWKP
jgi:hypothetical protein